MSRYYVPLSEKEKLDSSLYVKLENGEIKRLTQKQKDFADAFILTGDATQAIEMSGYKGNSPKALGEKMLKDEYIIEYIKNNLKEVQSMKIADQEEILAFLTEVMRGEVTEQVIMCTPRGDIEVREKPADIKDRINSAKELAKRFSVVDAEFKKKIELKKIEIAEKNIALKEKALNGDSGDDIEIVVEDVVEDYEEEED